VGDRHCAAATSGDDGVARDGGGGGGGAAAESSGARGGGVDDGGRARASLSPSSSTASKKRARGGGGGGGGARGARDDDLSGDDERDARGDDGPVLARYACQRSHALGANRNASACALFSELRDRWECVGRRRCARSSVAVSRAGSRSRSRGSLSRSLTAFRAVFMWLLASGAVRSRLFGTPVAQFTWVAVSRSRTLPR